MPIWVDPGGEEITFLGDLSGVDVGRLSWSSGHHVEYLCLSRYEVGARRLISWSAMNLLTAITASEPV